MAKRGMRCWSLLDRQALPDLFVTTKGVADDLGVAKEKIAAAVINMMMGVDQPGDRSSGHFPDRPEKTGGHGRNHEGVNRHDAFTVQEQAGVAHTQFAIRLNIGVDFWRDLLYPRPPAGGSDVVLHTVTRV